MGTYTEMSFSQFVSAVQNAIRREDGAALQTNCTCADHSCCAAWRHADQHMSLIAGAQLRGLLQINNPDASSAVFEVGHGVHFVTVTEFFA